MDQSNRIGKKKIFLAVLTITSYLLQSLGLFINMVEHCDSNRQMIIDTYVHNSYEAEFAQPSTPALEALVQVRNSFMTTTCVGMPNLLVN